MTPKYSFSISNRPQVFIIDTTALGQTSKKRQRRLIKHIIAQIAHTIEEAIRLIDHTVAELSQIIALLGVDIGYFEKQPIADTIKKKLVNLPYIIAQRSYMTALSAVDKQHSGNNKDVKSFEKTPSRMRGNSEDIISQKAH